MTKPKKSTIHCSVCGRKVGTKPGETVVLGVVCDQPECNFQPEPSLTIERDSAIVALANDGAKVQTVANAAGMSRQRVYQIFDAWKKGA